MIRFKSMSTMRIPPLLAAMLLVGCASTPSPEDQSIAELTAAAMARQNGLEQVQSVPVQSNQPEALVSTPEVRAKPTLFPGDDKLIRVPRARAQVSTQGEAVSLRFEQAPVADVVHAILGDLLKADYSIVQPLVGEISLHTHQPVPRDQMLDMLESLLRAKGIVMVPDANGRYQVGPPEAVRTAIPLPAMLGNLPVGFSTVIVPLRYIGAAEMVDILKPVTATENIFRVDTVRNLLMLAGSRTQIDAWMEIVSMFDVDFLKGMSVGLFPLEHAPVREVDAALKTLFSGAESGGRGAAGGAAAASGEVAIQAQPGQSASVGSARSIGGPLGGVIRFLPIERLNALLVVTPRAHYLEQVRTWIERFDRPIETDLEPQLYVYPIQNGSAQHLAKLLSSIYASGDSASSGARASDSGVAPGLASSGMGSAGALGSNNMGLGSGIGFGSSLANSFGSGFGSGAATQAGGTETTQVNLGGVRVIADDHNNALLIYAPRKDYRRIEAALRQLDVAPTQVLIEASIIEVTLSDELKYGLQWYFNGSLGSNYTGSGQLTSNDTGVIGASNPGFSYAITNPLGEIRAVLNALAQKNLLNVISTPSVLVQDNYTAQIHVGDQQPIRTSTTVTDGGNTSESIDYKDTGVMLAVQPSVNAGGMVTMNIRQTLTDVGAEPDIATGQRPFLQRQVSSRVAVRTGETVVLGGLIRDNVTRSKQGIPVLYEIPVFGNLFGATSIKNSRTELMVLITPRVLRNDKDLREVNTELRERMRSIRELTARLRPDDVPEKLLPDDMQALGHPDELRLPAGELLEQGSSSGP
ncbi:MAG TPA: type II secretion system secretin GspD [Rhodocyclaceae bacterium]|nr:type II secretion system secretin GspD [Rhodocyclaceae bacterium]